MAYSAGMYVKITRSGPRRYVQLVESYRDEEGKVKQRTIATPEGSRPYAAQSFWVSNASLAGLPAVVAPVAKRLTISLAGSTSSRGTAGPAGLISKSPRRVMCRLL